MDSFVETDNNCLNESSRSIGVRENNIFVDTGFRRRWDIRVKIPVAFWSVIKGSFIYANPLSPAWMLFLKSRAVLKESQERVPL